RRCRGRRRGGRRGAVREEVLNLALARRALERFKVEVEVCRGAAGAHRGRARFLRRRTRLLAARNGACEQGERDHGGGGAWRQIAGQELSHFCRRCRVTTTSASTRVSFALRRRKVI